MAHKGKFYPHVKDLDHRFPEPPWRVPPKLWILQGCTFTGAFAGDFPAQPWTVGLASVVRSNEYIEWTTTWPVSGGFTAGVVVGSKLLMPFYWIGLYINIFTRTAQSNTSLYKEVTGSDFSGATFANVFSSTQPSNLTLTSGGSVVPKPW